MPVFDSRLWRLAGRLAGRLAERHRNDRLPPLNHSDWQRTQRLIQRYTELAQRQRTLAREQICRQLCTTIGYLGTNLARIRDALPTGGFSEEFPTQREIYDELLASRVEFEGFQFDLRLQTLSVLSPEIELEDIFLGRFRIVIDYSDLGGDYMRIVAERTDRRDETHPHVNGERLCEGQAEQPLRAALEGGRFSDFFQIVIQTLQTYNRESAYFSLSDTDDDFDCHACGGRTSEYARYYCENCGDVFCEGCSRTCDRCSASTCDDCAGRCEVCENVVCHRCLNTCADCSRSCCSTCLTETRCEDCDDEDEISEDEDTFAAKAATVAAVHTACVGEAAVPAGSGAD